MKQEPCDFRRGRFRRTYETSRKGWLLLMGWLVPVICASFVPDTDYSQNGLVVLLCAIYYRLCSHGVSCAMLWNVHIRKLHIILFCILYILLLIPLCYVYAQAQMYGAFPDFQGFQLMQTDWLRMGMGFVLLLLMNIGYTRMVYTSIDCFFHRKEEIRLLACHTYRAGDNDQGRGLYQGYYLEGIQNGVTYCFRMTKKAHQQLHTKTKMILQLRRGCFGGLYVTELPSESSTSQSQKKQKYKIIAFWLCGIIFTIIGFLLFW